MAVEVFILSCNFIPLTWNLAEDTKIIIYFKNCLAYGKYYFMNFSLRESLNLCCNIIANVMFTLFCMLIALNTVFPLDAFSEALVY